MMRGGEEPLPARLCWGFSSGSMFAVCACDQRCRRASQAFLCVGPPRAARTASGILGVAVPNPSQSGNYVKPVLF
jgi:hypothetical protein